MSLYYRRPCKTDRVTADFRAHVARGSLMPGIDYACPIGEKCVASANGKVVFASNNPNQATGRYIVIKHRDGRETKYLHLSRIDVRVGQRVLGGKVIGLTGNSSSGNSTGPHLHFTMTDRNGKCVDPHPILRKSWLDHIRSERRKKRKAKES